MACILSRPAPRRPPLSQELGVQPDFLPLPHLSPLMRSTTLTSHLTTVRGRSSSSPARPPPGWPSGPLTSPAPSGTPPLASPQPSPPPRSLPPAPLLRLSGGAEEPWGELTCSVPALSEGATCASGLRLQTTGVPEVSPLPTLVPSALCPPPSAGARDGTPHPCAGDCILGGQCLLSQLWQREFLGLTLLRPPASMPDLGAPLRVPPAPAVRPTGRGPRWHLHPETLRVPHPAAPPQE